MESASNEKDPPKLLFKNFCAAYFFVYYYYYFYILAICRRILWRTVISFSFDNFISLFFEGVVNSVYYDCMIPGSCSFYECNYYRVEKVSYRNV